MTKGQSIEALAREFWSGCGPEPDFPRNIERAIPMTLPLAVVKIRQLDSQIVKVWLQRRKVSVPVPVSRQDLMGCLVAHRGYGIVFVCGSDEPEEQRMTIAHEAAHFLSDYLLPRRQVIAALGDGVEEVLDGLRPARPRERAAAVLSHVRLGPHLHLFPRMEGDEYSASLACVESRADELAVELVAPRASVKSLFRQLSSLRMPEQTVIHELARYFGLPAYAFDFAVRKMGQRRPVSFVHEAIPRIRGSS